MKPKVIQELEQELNCTFDLVESHKITQYTPSKRANYSLDQNGNVSGIAICVYNLIKIPDSLISNSENLLSLVSLDLQDNMISDVNVLSNLGKT